MEHENYKIVNNILLFIIHILKENHLMKFNGKMYFEIHK